MRKHTRRIEDELPHRVADGIARLGSFRDASAHRIEQLQSLPVSDAQAHDLIVRSVDDRCIGLRELPKVLHEWREPSHDEFRPRTGWSLHNAFTEVAKQRFERNPTTAASQTMRLNRLLTGMLN